MSEERKCTDPKKPFCIGPKDENKNLTNCYGEKYDVDKEFEALFNPNDPGYLKTKSLANAYCVGLDSAIITNAAEAGRQLQNAFQNEEYKNEISKITSLFIRDKPNVDKIIQMLTAQLTNSKSFMIKALTDDTMINYIKRVVETLKIKWDTDSNSTTLAAELVRKFKEQVNQYETNKPNMSAEIGRLIDAKVASIQGEEFKIRLTEELATLNKNPEILAEIINDTQVQITSSLQGIIKIGLFAMLEAKDISLHTVEQLFPEKQTGGLGVMLTILRGITGLIVAGVSKVLSYSSGTLALCPWVFTMGVGGIFFEEEVNNFVFAPARFFNKLSSTSYHWAVGDGWNWTNKDDSNRAQNGSGKSLLRTKKTRKGSRRLNKALKSRAARRKRSRKSRRLRSRK